MALYDGPQPSPSPGQAPQSLDNAIGEIVKSGAVGGTTTGASTKDPPVFTGWGTFTPKPLGTGPYAPGYAPSTVGNFAMTPQLTKPLSQVANEYYTWDQKTKDKFLTQLSLAGYDTTQMPDAKMAQLWGAYASQAASYYGAGVNVTPWDIMAKDRAQREAASRAPRSVTQTSKNFDLSTEGDARAIFYTAAQQLLGRDPTKAEAKNFQAALNKMERANPTVTTTTSNYLGQDLQSQESTTTGGVKEGARQMEAMDQAKAQPEYGAYQAATTYFDAMMDMIGGMQ